jgi:glutamate carboxypeptidase
MELAALRDLLIRWAEINSGSSNLAGLERMRQALVAEFRTVPHAQVESVPLEGTTAQAVRVLIKPSAPTQLLISGHFDTVYGAHNAFQRCTLVEPDMLRGPGVADMKGGIVVLIAALREFLTTPNATRIGFDILLTPDEEIGSPGGRHLIESVARTKQHAAALVFEPARGNGDLVRTRKGTGVFTLTCHGRAAHAGRDSGSGCNAIVSLSELLLQVAELERDLDGVSVNVGNIRGGGAVNIVPDFAEAQIDVRTTRAGVDADVTECLHALAEPINQKQGCRIVISGGFNRPPKEITPADEQLFASWVRCGRDLGVPLSWHDIGGAGDANLISSAGIPTLDGLGPVGDKLHSSEEFIRLSSLVERARIAARFLEVFAASHSSGT